MARPLVLALTLSSFFGISFILCVLGGVLAPGLPITHQTLELILPGFVWITPGSFFLGLLESIGYGLYVGLVAGALYEFFAGRSAAEGVRRLTVSAHKSL